MKTNRLSRRIVEIAALEARRLFSADDEIFCSAARMPGAAELESQPKPASYNTESIDVLAVPAYSSRPGTLAKVYLDFNGNGAIDNWGGWWEFGGKNVTATQAYDIDFNTDSFSTAELANIEKIWKIAAEKFSPFDIDVTTIRPNTVYGVHMVIGGDGNWNGGGGGVAHRGGFGFSFGAPNDLNAVNVAFVWDGQGTGPSGSNPDYIGETIAHEAGHTLGLAHQSALPLNETNEYAPDLIMGQGSNTSIARWANTALSGTTSSGRDWLDDIENEGSQDDLARIVGNIAVDYRPDDHGGVGGSFGNATNLPINFQSGVLEGNARGVIEREFDLDVFKIEHTGGSLDIEVMPAEHRAMLDPFVTLRGANNQNLAVSNSNNGQLTFGEKLRIPVQAAGTYWIAVGSAIGYGSIGQFTLKVSGGLDATASNNTMTTATALGIFGSTDPAQQSGGFQGTTTFTDTLTLADQYDFFKVRMPRNARQLHVQMNAQTTNVSLAVYDDLNFNGQVDVGEFIYATNPSMQFHTTTYNFAVPGKTYYIRAGRASASGAGTYQLSASVDTAPSTLPVAEPTAAFDPQPLVGGKTVYESLNLATSDVDYYRVTAERAGLLTFDMQNFGGDMRMDAGTDVNGNGVLDAGEITASSINAGSASELIQNFAVVENQKVLVRISSQVVGGGGNYRLLASADYSTGTNANALGTARNLTSMSAGTVFEYIESFAGIDLVDNFRIAPTIGAFTAQLRPVDPSGFHKLEIIRDGNNNGTVEAGEVVATNTNNTVINYNVIAGGTYYLRASFQNIGEFFSSGNYKINFAASGALSGSTFTAPGNITVLPTSSIIGGYLGYDANDPMFQNTEDYYRFTLTSRTRFDAAVNGPGMGIQVGKVDGSGFFQRIGGTGQNQSIATSLNVNLDPGTYLMRVYLPVGGGGIGTNSTAGGNYGLSFETSPITDNSPPVVTSAEFQYEIAPQGMSFTMDQDIAGSSIELGDLTVRNLATNVVYPVSERYYNATTHRVGYGLAAGILPDGNYRATLAAGSLSDMSANTLAAAYNLDFFVFSGDADRNRTVNISDFSILASRFNLPGTFSIGDFNYSGAVEIGDFSILASKFNTILPAARQAPAGVMAAAPAAREVFSSERLIETVGV